jgi:hypothetical protein
MNYRNYEGKIVKKYGVALKGWTSSIPKVCNPSTVSGWPILEKLLSTLQLGHCRWVLLTDDKLEERKEANIAQENCGEEVYKPQKSTARMDNAKGLKSQEIIDESEDKEDMTPATDKGEGQEDSSNNKEINNSSEDHDMAGGDGAADSPAGGYSDRGNMETN